MDKLKLIEQTVIRDDIPHFTAGDTINVHYRVREGDKERIQQYKGVVINERGSGANKTVTVRKMSGNIGVERIFPLYSPFIAKIEVSKKGKVRRSKLFYLRKLRGKAARIQEKVKGQGPVQADVDIDGQPPVQAEAESPKPAQAEVKGQGSAQAEVKEQPPAAEES